MDKPIILVSNDDGYFAEGISFLQEELKELGRVIVVAPDRDCSGISHKISIHTPLRLRSISEDVYALNGSPADCIHLAIHGVLNGKKPDLVVSGINHGFNLGEDTAYSGTVAAAYEGFIQDIPAIAVSSEKKGDQFNFLDAAIAAKILAKKALSGDALFNNAVWNVNVPLKRTKGFKVTMLDSRSFKSSVVRRIDPRGQEYFWLGPYYPEYSEGESTDFEAIKQGYIPLTPLKVEMSHQSMIHEIWHKNLEPFNWEP